METAIYCRVSTEEQAQEGFSIRAQEQKLKEYANVKEWSIYNIYMDEGISGKNITERPAITRMIEDIKAGYVKNVLVFKLDRLTRSVADLVYLIDVFNKNSCAFNSLMESLDTSTASGRMFIKIIGIFAEFERENIAERVRVGKERKAREGYTNCTRSISYGYDRDYGNLIQSVNEAEAETVRVIFDMYVNQGKSLAAITRSLNLQRIPSKTGTVWNSGSIKGILTNCSYIGKIRYGIRSPERYFESEGKHEAIISEDLYNAAQILIKKNSQTAPTKKPVEPNYFVGFIYCALCGEKYNTQNAQYVTKRGEKKTLYSFACRMRLVKGDFCKSKQTAATKIEAALIEYFSEYEEMFTSDSETAAILQQEKQNNEAKIQNYREQLRHYDNREKEVMSHYISGAIEFESYRDMKKQLDSDRDFIRAEIAKYTVDEENNPVNVTREEIAASFKENWKRLTDAEKRLFLTNYIKKIFIKSVPIEGSRRDKAIVTNIEFNTY